VSWTFFTPSPGSALVATTVAGLGTAPTSGTNGLIRMGSSPYTFVPLVYDSTYAKWVSPTMTVKGTDASVSAFTQNAQAVQFSLPLWSEYVTAGLSVVARATAWYVSNQSNANGGWQFRYSSQAVNLAHPTGGYGSVAASSTTASTTETYMDTLWQAMNPASADHFFCSLGFDATNTSQTENWYNPMIQLRLVG
jgi:hypothetical protein